MRVFRIGNLIVRNQLFILAGPDIGLLQYMRDRRRLPFNRNGHRHAFWRHCCPLYLRSYPQRSARLWFQAITQQTSLVLLFFSTLAYPGLIQLGIFDGGSYLICLVPMIAGFFVGRKWATIMLVLVFAYAGALAYKHTFVPGYRDINGLHY